MKLRSASSDSYPAKNAGLPRYRVREQFYGREVGGSCDAMPAAGCERSEADFVNLAQVGILHLEHDDDLLLVELVPLHSGEGDFHLHKLAIGGNTAATNSKHAVGQLHDRIKRVDRVGAHDPA